MPYGKLALDTIETSGNLDITGNTVVAGNITVTGTIASSNGTTYPLVSATAQATTSGTSFLFSNIPSWVKRITVMAYGISTNGTSSVAVRLGTSAGIANTGYFSMVGQLTTAGAASAASNTTGLYLSASAAAMIAYSTLVITLMDSVNNYWVASGISVRDEATDVIQQLGGAVALTGSVTQLQVTTLGGTDTFDAGTVNIMYE